MSGVPGRLLLTPKNFQGVLPGPIIRDERGTRRAEVGVVGSSQAVGFGPTGGGKFDSHFHGAAQAAAVRSTAAGEIQRGAVIDGCPEDG